MVNYSGEIWHASKFKGAQKHELGQYSQKKNQITYK